MRRCVVIIALAACQKADAPKTVRCEQLPFAESTPVPEASGAAWLVLNGRPALLVISDSGNHGAYVIVDAETGETREQGLLPLGDKGDDIEGLASRGELFYGLTSAGWMHVWRRSGARFQLVDGPYAIGSTDGPDAMVCKRGLGNCGRNYEGLAIAPRVTTPCSGFACSKSDGALYCLTERDGRFTADPTGAITFDKPDALADCAFAGNGTLWAGDNLLGMSEVYRIDGWAQPTTAKVVPIDILGVGFPEVIAVRSDVIYRMSDTGGEPSLMAKFRCQGIVP